MTRFFHYSISINETPFGLMYNPLPLLHDTVRSIDKASWGPFSIKLISQDVIPWVQKRKLQQITAKVMSALTADLIPQDFFLVPAKKETVDFEYAMAESDCLSSFVETLKSAQIDVLNIYKMPEHPNEYVPNDPNHHSQETYTDCHNLSLMKEQISSDINVKSLFDKNCGYTFRADSVFPIDNENHSFPNLLKFISFFRCCIFRIGPLSTLLKQFSLSETYFPYVIEAFSVELIPSFTHHHNSFEKLGDAALSLCVVTDIIKALPDQPLYYINHKYNKSISNDLFNVIGAQYNFASCVIGPIDEAKVPADCFEALSGVLYFKDGFSAVSNFWQQRIFNIDDSYLNANQMSKTINLMRLNLRNAVSEVKPGLNMPPYARKFIGENINAPAQDSFTQGTEMQQKCKMIGAAFLKLAVALAVFESQTTDEDILAIERKMKKESINEIAQKIGFPNGRMLKIFIGGLFLTNDYDSVKKVIDLEFIGFFEISQKKRRRHRRHHAISTHDNNDNDNE